MAFTLRIEFSGPCVYVPSGPGEQFSELTVLMVDARQPDPGSLQASHVPVLLFNLADLQTSTSASFMPLEGGERGAVFLDREEILLTGAGEKSLSVYNSDQLGDPGDRRFGFNWMPRLEEALPGSGDVIPEALTSEPPPAVIARARLTRGDLFTANMSAQSGAFLRWTFKPSGEPIESGDPLRQIGLDVGLQLQVDDAANIILERFESGARRVISFAPPQNENEVTLTFANREPSFILSGTEPNEEVSEDPDFAFLYRLSANAAVANQPKPIPRMTGGASLGGITCGGGVSNSG